MKSLGGILDRIRKRRVAEWIPLLTIKMYRDRYGPSPSSRTIYLSDRTITQEAQGVSWAILDGSEVLPDWLPVVSHWGGFLGSELGYQGPALNPMSITVRLSLKQRLGATQQLLYLIRYGANSGGYELSGADVLFQLAYPNQGSTPIIIARGRVAEIKPVSQEEATLRIVGIEAALDPEDGDVAMAITGEDPFPGFHYLLFQKMDDGSGGTGGFGDGSGSAYVAELSSALPVLTGGEAELGVFWNRAWLFGAAYQVHDRWVGLYRALSEVSGNTLRFQIPVHSADPRSDLAYHELRAGPLDTYGPAVLKVVRFEEPPTLVALQAFTFNSPPTVVSTLGTIPHSGTDASPIDVEIPIGNARFIGIQVSSPAPSAPPNQAPSTSVNSAGLDAYGGTFLSFITT